MLLGRALALAIRLLDTVRELAKGPRTSRELGWDSADPCHSGPCGESQLHGIANATDSPQSMISTDIEYNAISNLDLRYCDAMT